MPIVKPIRSRVSRARSVTSAIPAALSVALLSACGSSATPPPRVQHEDPSAHVRRVASVWHEEIEEEGLPDGDPEVAFFRIHADLRVELGAEGRAREAIERKELFRMRDGFEFHCAVKGVIDAHAQYETVRGEIHLALVNPAARLARECREPGFKKTWKDVPAGSTTFALRSDRLIAVDPPRARNILLPAQ
jgi:hypothetical protein